jgi:hypothetical protein
MLKLWLAPGKGPLSGVPSPPIEMRASATAGGVSPKLLGGSRASVLSLRSNTPQRSRHSDGGDERAAWPVFGILAKCALWPDSITIPAAK